MKHIIKNDSSNQYVKNVVHSNNSIQIKFTEKRENARYFSKYEAASIVVKHFLGNCYKVITLQD